MRRLRLEYSSRTRDALRLVLGEPRHVYGSRDRSRRVSRCDRNLSESRVEDSMNRVARVYSIAATIMRNTRNFDPDAPNAWQMLGMGRGAYGMTCAELAQEYGISRTQAWRDKRDAVEWLYRRACDCHLSRNCPRSRRAWNRIPRDVYTSKVARLAMEQTR